MENNSIIQCQYCKENYRDPRILECLHSFCFKCIQEIASKYNFASDQPLVNCLICPVCRVPTRFFRSQDGVSAAAGGGCPPAVIKMPTGSVTTLADLPDNSLLCRLASDATSLQQYQQRSGKSCSECQARAGATAAFNSQLSGQPPPADQQRLGVINIAICRCIDCNSNLCGNCLNVHNSYPSYSTHHVYVLQPDENGSEYYQDSSRRPLACRVHGCQTCDGYCRRCCLPVCPTCYNTVHYQHPEDVDMLDHMLPVWRDQLYHHHQRSAGIMTRYVDMCTRLYDDAEKRRRDVAENVRTVTTAMDAHFAELRGLIDRQQADMHGFAQLYFSQETKNVDGLRELMKQRSDLIINAVQLTKTLLEYGTSAELCQLTGRVQAEANGIISKVSFFRIMSISLSYAWFILRSP